jgi:hypothetical protein
MSCGISDRMIAKKINASEPVFTASARDRRSARPAAFAADALDEAKHGEDDSAPDADARIRS